MLVKSLKASYLFQYRHNVKLCLQLPPSNGKHALLPGQPAWSAAEASPQARRLVKLLSTPVGLSIVKCYIAVRCFLCLFKVLMLALWLVIKPLDHEMVKLVELEKHEHEGEPYADSFVKSAHVSNPVK